jgi:hypothetical protein
MIRSLTLSSAIVCFLTICLFYLSRSWPIQMTSPTLVKVGLILGMLNTFGLIILMAKAGLFDRIGSVAGRIAFWMIVTVVVLHNLFWTAMNMGAEEFVDVEVVRIDKEDQNRKIIRQHIDYGVFGDSFRTVQVYETPFFFRVIEKEIERD